MDPTGWQVQYTLTQLESLNPNALILMNPNNINSKPLKWNGWDERVAGLLLGKEPVNDVALIKRKYESFKNSLGFTV